MHRRLQQALTHAGLTGADASAAVGRSRTYVSDILTGKSRGGAQIAKLAEVLRVDPVWLRDGTGSPPAWWTDDTPPASDIPPDPNADLRQQVQDLEANHPHLVKWGFGIIPRVRLAMLERAAQQQYIHLSGTDREIPVLGQVAANGDRWGDIEQPEMRHHRFKKSFALVQVMGDSAYPVAFPGQFVVVDTDRPVRDQNLVVVVLWDGRALLKRYCAIPGEPNRMLLASVNIGLGSLLIDRSEVRYLHPVVGVMFE